MRRMGDLMSDLGFNKDAPLETQKAFILHLIRAANGNTRAPQSSPQPQAPVVQETKAAVPGEQLSFDLEILLTK